MTLMSSVTTILPPVRLFPSSFIPLKQDNFSDGEGEKEEVEEEENERGGWGGQTLLIKHLRLIVMKCHP